MVTAQYKAHACGINTTRNHSIACLFKSLKADEGVRLCNCLKAQLQTPLQKIRVTLNLISNTNALRNKRPTPKSSTKRQSNSQLV